MHAIVGTQAHITARINIPVVHAQVAIIDGHASAGIHVYSAICRYICVFEINVAARAYVHVTAIGGNSCFVGCHVATSMHF